MTTHEVAESILKCLSIIPEKIMHNRCMKLKRQTQKQVQEMMKAGYPICLSKGDWSGNYRRHCNACIEQYKKIKRK